MPVNFDVNLPEQVFERTFQLPDGATFRAPFTAGGQTQSINLSRPNAAFGAITVVRSIGGAWYDALLAELKRRFSSGVQLRIAYTLAKAENLSGSGDGGGSGAESVGPFAGARLADQTNIDSNRGTSPTDQRHRLVASGIWQPKGKLLGGFLFSGIYSAESGRPVSALLNLPSIPFATPDGTQWNGFGGVRGQGGANFLPTIRRNSHYGQSNFRLDLRVARLLRVKERLTIEAIAEGFNLFNRSNYTDFNTTIYDGTATAATARLSDPVVLRVNPTFLLPVGDGGQPDGTNARRFQLALRFRF